MMTFKQLEAIYWVARLGGFSQAAQKLYTTQSALSKRIQDLEALFDTPLFDRTLRTARLTEKGEEMYALSKRLLAEREAAVEQFMRPEVIERRLRLGVTELTAMTWLPRLVEQIQAIYPRVVIAPDVDTSVALRDKLLADELDLMIVPNAFDDPRFTVRPVGEVELAWVCKPGLIDTRKTLRLHDLPKDRILIQSSASGTGLVVDRWLGSMGFKFTGVLSSNNMLALVGMTVSGLGMTYLPWRCLMPMIDGGMLSRVKVTPEIPPTPYVAMFRTDQRSTLISSIATLAQECCDFTRTFQTTMAR